MEVSIRTVGTRKSVTLLFNGAELDLGLLDGNECTILADKLIEAAKELEEE